MTFESARERLVARLERSGHVERESTAAAMREVPRHAFVPADRRGEAYADRPLPIGEGQTISAPHMVAIMLDLLELEPGDRVLEIGTGCGYHAALSAAIVGPSNVFSVEYHAALAREARATLAELGYGDVSIRAGDGNEGWPEHAPFDTAYLTCAPDAIPDPVIAQVSDGIVLGPVGGRRQQLVRLRRRAGETISRETHGDVRFVPMRGGD